MITYKSQVLFKHYDLFSQLGKCVRAHVGQEKGKDNCISDPAPNLTVTLHLFLHSFPNGFLKERTIKISKRKSNIGVTFFRINTSIRGISILKMLSVYDYIVFSVSLTLVVS